MFIHGVRVLRAETDRETFVDVVVVECAKDFCSSRVVLFFGG